MSHGGGVPAVCAVRKGRYNAGAATGRKRRQAEEI